MGRQSGPEASGRQARWRTGFEIELLAPAGRSRRDLAERTAAAFGGRVERFFHAQTEPSKVPGQPTFNNLSPGFRVRDGAGRPIAAFVCDITLQHDLDRAAPPQPGWYRIVSDDARLIRLAQRHCDPDAALAVVLAPLAALFGGTTETHPSGMVRVGDGEGRPVAVAAPLPGERERATEIVTAPLGPERDEVVARLLALAREEGFSLPREGATHIHFDGAPLRRARVLATLIGLLDRHGDALKRMVGVNPHCVRLGPWPDALAPLARSRAFRAADWPTAAAMLSTVGLSKYCDYNLKNILAADPAKDTVEVRVLPASLDPAPVLAAASLFEALLHWCVEREAVRRVPDRLDRLLAALDLPPAVRQAWIETAAEARG